MSDTRTGALLKTYQSKCQAPRLLFGLSRWVTPKFCTQCLCAAPVPRSKFAILPARSRLRNLWRQKWLHRELKEAHYINIQLLSAKSRQSPNPLNPSVTFSPRQQRRSKSLNLLRAVYGDHPAVPISRLPPPRWLAPPAGLSEASREAPGYAAAKLPEPNWATGAAPHPHWITRHLYLLYSFIIIYYILLSSTATSDGLDNDISTK